MSCDIGVRHHVSKGPHEAIHSSAPCGIQTCRIVRDAVSIRIDLNCIAIDVCSHPGDRGFEGVEENTVKGKVRVHQQLISILCKEIGNFRLGHVQHVAIARPILNPVAFYVVKEIRLQDPWGAGANFISTDGHQDDCTRRLSSYGTCLIGREAWAEEDADLPQLVGAVLILLSVGSPAIDNRPTKPTEDRLGTPAFGN